MKIVAIIQARMGSTRLPGKVLIDLSGETVLAHVIRRVRLSTLIDSVEIATTTSSADEKIVCEAVRLNVPVFRGSEEDVLDRYWQASQKSGAQVVVRITADCPVIDCAVVDATIRAFLDQEADYASNRIPPSYPRGLDTEVFTVSAFEKAWKNATKPYEREHVTPYFYQHPELFRLAAIANETDYSHYRWTLDTPEDLALMRAIYSHFAGQDYFSWQEILRLMEDQPALAAINAHVQQKQLQEK
jgi:spore coat polysaccharide biosynthesis protein SpsF